MKTPSASRFTATNRAGLLAAVALVAIPVFILWRAIFLGETIGAFGLAQQFGVPGVSGRAWPVDLLQLDGVLQFYPWRDAVLSSWRVGTMPLWNPYVLFGTPLLANSQSGGLYPPHVLLGLLQVPTGLAITLLAWFHLSILGGGCYALARELGAIRTAAMLAALSVVGSTFMIAWLPLASVVSTLAWLPWVLFGLRRQRATPWAALAVGMMLLGGHLQFAAFGLMASVVWLCFADRTRWLPGLGALALGAVMASGQLMAVLDYSQFSHRRNAPSEEGFAAYSRSALAAQDLALLVIPFALGDPTARVSQEERFSASEFWPAHPLNQRPSANFAEQALTLGPLAWFGLFFVAWRRDRAAWALGAVALLGALVAFGSPLCRFLYFAVPGWSGTGSPGRAVVLVVLALAVASALGWHRVLTERAASRRRWTLYWVGLLFGAVATVSSQMVQRSESAAPLEPLVAQGLITGLTQFVIGALIVAALLFIQLTKAAWTAPAGFLAGIACMVSMGATNLVPTGRVEVVPQPSSERVAVAAPEVLPGAYRQNPPNWNMVLRQPRVDGYDSLIHRDTVALLKRLNSDRDPAVLVNGNMMAPDLTTAPRGVGVSALVGPDGTEIEQTGERRASLNGVGVAITNETPMSISVEIDGPGDLIVHDRAMPGWRATLNGQPLPLIPGEFLKVRAPQSGRVEFVYWPYRVHPWIPFALALLAVAGWLALSRGGASSAARAE